jgi:large subunit ribosomal protein L17e
MREAAKQLKNKPLRRAVDYLKNVIARRECVPYLRYNGGVGRCAQVSALGVNVSVGC